MNCEHYEDAIGDLVDGSIDEARRIEVERHLRDCEPCRELLADLRQIRAAAAHLPQQAPPRAVWNRIAAQLPAPAPREKRSFFHALWATPPFGSRSTRLRLAWSAGAALAVALLVFAVALPRMRPAAPRQASTAPSSAAVHANDAELVQSVESELRLAEQHYEKAITGLEQIAKAGEGTLDPAVASTLRKNLSVVDQAIHDSRLALQTQPTNELAQESLFEAFRRKVGLLQDTVGLINEMRKGNQAEAAKIIGSMNKS